MTLTNSIPQTTPRRPSRLVCGFTLMELMVAMAVFTLLTAGVLSSHLTGMRMRKLTEAKLSGTASGRRALNEISEKVRTAKLLSVGTGDEASFKPVQVSAAQAGNALQICGTTNTQVFTRYYVDSAEKSLMRVSSDDLAPTIIARDITNTVVFTAEDFRGTVLTNSQNNRVIRMVLDFHQWVHPLAKADGGAVYEFSRVQTRITRRAID